MSGLVLFHPAASLQTTSLSISFSSLTHPITGVTRCIIGLFILNVTEAGGQSERGSWPHVLCLTSSFACGKNYVIG